MLTPFAKRLCCRIGANLVCTKSTCQSFGCRACVRNSGGEGGSRTRRGGGVRWRRHARSPRGPPPRWSSLRATVGVTPGATVGVTPGVTPGVTLGATPGVTVGAEARPPGRRAPRRSRQQPPARVVAARCGPPREARMHIAGPPTRRPQSRSTTPHCHGRTRSSRRRGPCGECSYCTIYLDGSKHSI